MKRSDKLIAALIVETITLVIIGVGLWYALSLEPLQAGVLVVCLGWLVRHFSRRKP